MLTVMGRDLARCANPANYGHEHRYKADQYAVGLKATREAYRQINNGADPLTALAALEAPVLTGIDANFLRLLVGAIKGKYVNHPSILAAIKEVK